MKRRWPLDWNEYWRELDRGDWLHTPFLTAVGLRGGARSSATQLLGLPSYSCFAPSYSRCQNWSTSLPGHARAFAQATHAHVFHKPRRILTLLHKIYILFNNGHWPGQRLCRRQHYIRWHLATIPFNEGLQKRGPGRGWINSWHLSLEVTHSVHALRPHASPLRQSTNQKKKKNFKRTRVCMDIQVTYPSF